MRPYKQFSDCKICKKEFPREKLRLRPNGTLRERLCKNCQIKKYYEYLDNPNLKETKFYLKFKGKKCNKCGFEGHPVQLDVNHKDGNHQNNDPTNFETLCANCHRLVTYQLRHGIYKNLKRAA